jgi:hypothetical protein
MTKPDFQKELLEKIKQGVKPSDLKKSKNINGEKDFEPLSLPVDGSLFSPSHQENNTPASSPPASPVIVPVDKKNKQKQSPAKKDQIIQQLQGQVRF